MLPRVSSTKSNLKCSTRQTTFHLTVGEYCMVCKHGVNNHFVVHEGQLREARDVKEEKRLAEEERGPAIQKLISRVAIQWVKKEKRQAFTFSMESGPNLAGS